MYTIRKAAVTVAAMSAVTLGVAAGPASAAPQDGQGFTNTQVSAWTYSNVHTGPNTYSEVLSHVANGYTYSALCWTYGENITFHGYTSNKWVLLDRTWPKQNGYVTAIALSGDSTGGVPNKC